jgi:hypothetical protein
MSVAFPLNPKPSQYRTCSFPNNRCGIFYVGQTPVVTLSSSGGATGYSVRDYYGNVVSSGSVSGTTVTPTAPVGGWVCGWYRFYLTGGTNDALFGLSAGATSFVVIRNDSRFPTIPPVATPGNVGGEQRDVATKGFLGMGTSRMLIQNANAPTTGFDTIAVVQGDVVNAKAYWSAPTNPAYVDAARPRSLWTNFPNKATDYVEMVNGATVPMVRFYCATESIDGATVFITVAAGSSSGKKVTVAFPNSGTIIETYDNIADGNWTATVATINAASTKIKAFYTGTAGTPTNVASTAIGRSHYNGVRDTVIALYPDITHYEGPTNEPTLTSETAHAMRLFAAAVHAGNASAKAIGPTAVDITPGFSLQGWEAFLAAGGAAYCDAFSYHDYNSMANGNLSEGRGHIERWLALLTTYGVQNKERWQTEAGAAFTCVYGVHHPRRARVKIMHTLLWEQYGVPRERNSYWYDTSHGFWSFPTWWQNGDKSLTPDAPLHRTLAEETFGMTHSAKITFGDLLDRVYLASLYATPGGASCIVQQSASHIPNATVTYAISGTTSALTMVDAWGNTSSLTQTSGQVVVPIGEVPTYLRLPAGVVATVVTVNGWPNLTGSQRTLTLNSTTTTANTRRMARGITGEDWPKDYPFPTGTYQFTGTLPDGFVVEAPTPIRFDRALVWAGPSWQPNGTLLDFDIQTSDDRSSWTTQATVTKATPTSFLHGVSDENTGTQRETFWDEQWIFDVPLPAPVSAKYIRLYIRGASYGGEPDLACVTTGGQGTSDNTVALVLEMAILSDELSSKKIVAVTTL